jgi:poly(A) polymerase
VKEFAISIIRTLREHGHQAYLCGGCVRDLLLGREPADYDVTTDANPTEVMQIFPETYSVGAQFGVVLVPLSGKPAKDERTEIFVGGRASRMSLSDGGKSTDLFLDSEAHGLQQDRSQAGTDVSVPISSSHALCVEVATFRSDVGYSDGRHPDEVRFSSDPREDVRRRDFTINGLLLDPFTHEVLDYVDGRRDLEAGIIRAIGNPELRFTEDKLRMLRAVRFAARFQYAIDPATGKAIHKLAAQVHQVSRERVRDELTKMLTEGRARNALLLLDQSGLLHEVLPEVEAMKGVEQPPEYHPEGDVFVHTLLLLDQLNSPCAPTLAWGALLHDVGKPPTFRVAPDRIRFDGHVDVGVKMAQTICRRLRFSNTETEQILALVANHMRFADVERMKDSTFKRFVRMPLFDEHLELHRLDCESSHADLHLYHFTRDKMASMPPEVIRPAPLLTGEDLIAKGYEPGPLFKEILSAVEDGQLDGHLPSKEAAMEFVSRTFPLLKK